MKQNILRSIVKDIVEKLIQKLILIALFTSMETLGPKDIIK